MAAVLAAAMTAAAVTAAAAPAASARSHLPPVSHPQKDYAGSGVAAHEGRERRPAKRNLSRAWAAVTQTPGLDVSHYQGTVAWPEVYAKGARFAYIKATESTTFRDSAFNRNYTGSYYAGLIRGAYHFALPDRSSGRAQADFFVDHGGGWSPDGKTLPPALDIEYNPYGRTCYGLTPTKMVAWIREFSERVRARTRRYPTIYTTTNWWTTCTGNYAGFGRTNPLWIARYASSVGTLPAGWSFYTFWQHANSGIFPGDQDRFNGAYDRLQALARG